MLLIVGRSASGKDYLADSLVRKGAKKVRSYATRPKRFPGEATHRFVTVDEAKRITNRVAETKIGEYEYFVTKNQIKDADIYIIDPIGVKCLASKMSNQTFDLVYLIANRNEAEKMALKRAENSEAERKVFEQRVAAEAPEFDAFEQKIQDDPIANWFMTAKSIGSYLQCSHALYPNVVLREIFRNTFEKKVMEDEARYLFRKFVK